MNAAWPQIEELLAEIAALDAAERQERLAVLAQADSAVHAQLVRLLRASALDDGPMEPMMTVCTPVVPVQPARIGQRLGPYELQESIGKGGFGEVYRAERRDGELLQVVAIKVLQTTVVTAEEKARFLAEQAILARLEHPYLARFIDHGVSEQGQPYLVMEYVDGVDISEHCQQNKLSLEERIRLFLLVCQAVEHAHRSLVVHQDIKPGNILVSSDGVPRLLDFGIAGITSDGEPLAFGGLTLAFGSPEQLVEEGLTPRSDQYSLGVLLHQLVTGALPFLATTRLEQLKRIHAGIPGSIDVPALSDGRRRELRAILARALSVDAAARYDTVHDLVLDLEAFLVNRPVKAVAGGRGYRVAKFITRYRREFMLLAAAVAVVAVISGVYLKQHEETVRELAAQEARAARVASFMVGVFAEVDPARSGGDLDAVSLLTNARERARQEFGDDPAVEVQIMGSIGRILRELGIYEEAISIHEDVLDRHESFLETAPLARAQALFDRAYIAMDTGLYEQAVELHAEALKLRRTLLQAPHPDLADSLRELGYVNLEAGNSADSKQNLQDAADMYRELGDEYLSAWASTRMDQAGALRMEGRLEETIEICLEVLEIQQATYGELHPLVAQSHHNTGVVYSNLAKFEQSKFHAQTAIRLRTQLFGRDHPATNSSRNSLMGTALTEGHWWQGNAIGDEIFSRVGDSGFRWSDTLYQRLFGTSLGLRDLDAAERYITAWEAYLAESGFATRTFSTARAKLAFARGDYARSLELFTDATGERGDTEFSVQEIHARMLAQPDPRVIREFTARLEDYLAESTYPVHAPWDYLYLAAASRRLGDSEEARNHLATAMNYAVSVWGEDAIARAVFGVSAGRLFLDLGDVDEAQVHLEEARAVRDLNLGEGQGYARRAALLEDQLDGLAAAIREAGTR